jgi:predicted amino acid-binding ACT domain protein
VQVHVADRPGILAAIMQALGAERINIEDLELHHVSRERGGTLALLISGEEAANRAAAVLGTQGYDVDVAPELVV